jgi:hypothetical protein
MDMQDGQLVREFPAEVWARYQSLT